MAGGVRARIIELLDARGDGPGRKTVTALLLTAVGAAVLFGLFATLPDLDAGARLRLRLFGGAAAVVFTLEYSAPSLDRAGAPPLRPVIPGHRRSPDRAAVLAASGRDRAADGGHPRHAAGLGEAGALCAGLRPCRGGVPRRAARAVRRAHRSRPSCCCWCRASCICWNGTRSPTYSPASPRTLWWGIVTIASVGYGDMTPVTPWAGSSAAW